MRCVSMHGKQVGKTTGRENQCEPHGRLVYPYVLLIGQGPAFADGLSWLASYPYYGQPASSTLVAAGLAPGTMGKVAATQRSQPSGDSAVTSSQPLGARSTITESRSIGAQNGQAQMPAWWNDPLKSQERQTSPGLVPYHAVSVPWYDTPWVRSASGLRPLAPPCFLATASTIMWRTM